ncbi:MAG: hypothetical protein Q4C41_01555 [Eggerthellaceae bacterium]|nr:hypothetical protein [Eggerthellaceae bacterium]
MPGGCWICNPLCGRCRPTPYKSATCPDCGTVNLFEKARIVAGGPLLCKKCKRDLTADVTPKVVKCNYSGKLCAYPCGTSKSPKHEHGDQHCELNTPPSAEWLAAHPKVVEKLLGGNAS